MALDGRGRRFLRSLGHHLEPVIQVGKLGITESLLCAIEEALRRHELIKVRCGHKSPLSRSEIAETLCRSLSAELVQSLGHVLLLYRPNPETPRIRLP